ncbi:MAG TPA: hypothetical protein VGM23_03440 [Armatimonadota bacterium]|jgi:hypothetical protein
MQSVINWIWFGPWWAPLIGALYLAVLLSIAFAPILSIWKARR